MAVAAAKIRSRSSELSRTANGGGVSAVANRRSKMESANPVGQRVFVIVPTLLSGLAGRMPATTRSTNIVDGKERD